MPSHGPETFTSVVASYSTNDRSRTGSGTGDTFAMRERFGLRMARTIGVAVVSLLLIAGGAFAANGLITSGAPRSDNPASIGTNSESTETTETSETETTESDDTETTETTETSETTETKTTETT